MPGPEQAQTDPSARSFVATTKSFDRAMPPAQTSHREGYWKPPTDTQIENAARYGFDLTGQEKYFSKQEWANRNQVQ